jgi:GT2 family glycosyltransferase
MSRPLPTVSVVVLNWNGRRHLEGSLRSLERLDHPVDRLQLILVDNGSSDGSVEYVEASHPRWKIVRHLTNLGFAEGNNRGAAEATGEWIGFLNNDMRVEPGWLTALFGGLDACPGAACLASRILSWDGSRVDFVGGGVNYQGHGFQPDFGRPVSTGDNARGLLFACGGAMLVKRTVYEELGGFDPDFFAYFEDIDLGWRLNLLGHDVWYTPDATAYHHHHSTGGKVEPHRLRVLYERNALFTIYKCLDDANLAAALPAALLLLNERALLLSGADRESFRFGHSTTEPPKGAGTAPVGILPRAARVLREEGIAALASKSGRALRRKLAEPGPAGGAMAVEPIALSHYVALSEFAHSLDRLQEQRRTVQESRIRSDSEIIELAADFTHPNWADERYLQFYEWLNRVQGLDSRFGGQRP